MKQILALTLVLALLLCGCGRDESVSNTDTVTLYCLVQEDIYSEDILTQRNTYEYDNSGKLIRHEVFQGYVESIWNEEFGVYETELISADEIVDTAYCFAYDSFGNITQAQYTKYEDGQVTSDFTNYYSYTYGDSEEILRCEYHTNRELISPLNYYFTYQDGKIVNVDVYRSQDGESYGDMVQNYQFGYDDQGRLLQEQILFSGSNYREFINKYKYDDKGMVSSIVYRGSNDEGDYYAAQKFYHYDGCGGIYVYSGDEDDDPTEHQYCDDYDQFFFLFYPYPGMVIDENNNVAVIMETETGRRHEYTYQAMEVSQVEAQRYYRLWHIINAYPVEWDADYYFYYPIFFYHLIPNPIW